MKQIYSFLFIIAILGFMGCGEDDEPTATEYIVQIMQPDASAKSVGDVMHVHVNFDEISQGIVHHIKVELKNSVSGEVIYSKPDVAHIHEESGHYEHHDDITLDVDSGTSWVLEAKVWGHDEGVAEKMASVQFEVN